MRILRTIQGKYWNSPSVGKQTILACPGGTFEGFCRGYLNGFTTQLYAEVRDNEMLVETTYGTLIYRLQESRDL